MVFWDQIQNQLPTILKIPALSHWDHDHKSEFQSFHFEFKFWTSVTQLVLALRLNYGLRQ
jgi:hypothetical protein